MYMKGSMDSATPEVHAVRRERKLEGGGNLRVCTEGTSDIWRYS